MENQLDPKIAIKHIKHDVASDRTVLPKKIHAPRHDFIIVPNFSARTPDDSNPAYLRRATSDEHISIGSSLQAETVRNAAEFGVPLSAAQQEVATSIFDGIETWAKAELSVDIKDRRPSLDTFRRLTKEDKYDPNNKFGYVTRNHITVVPEIDELRKGLDTTKMEERSMAHEIVHGYGSQVWAVAHPDETIESVQSEYGQGKTIAYGFAVENILPNGKKREGSFNTLNEVVTEMINIEQLQRLKSEGKADLLDDLPLSYHGEVVLFDEIFDKMAARVGKSPEDMRKEIYQKYFKGRSSLSRTFMEIFGQEAAQIIAVMNREGDNCLNLVIDTFQGNNPEDPAYAPILRLMELTGIDRKEYTDKYLNIFHRKGAEITGATGKIEFNPIFL